MRCCSRLPAGIWFIFLVLFAFKPAYGQSLVEYQYLGNEAFSRGDAYSAAYYFGECIKIDSTRADFYYLLARSQSKYLDYQAASESYSKSLSMPGPDSLCQASFYRGLMLKQIADYERAVISLEEYLASCKQGGVAMREKASQEIRSCRQALQWNADSSVIIIHPGPEINTPFSEFAPQQLGDSILVFSSLRTNSSTSATSFIPGDNFSQIYESIITSAGWQQAGLSRSSLNKGRYHVANAHFTSDGKQVYFTRCLYTTSGAQQCAVYRISRTEKKWNRLEMLDTRINEPGYSSTQPFLLEGKDFDVLYFSSDRPGGYGGSDIWYSIIDDGEFQAAVNLGSIINTPGEEVSPSWFDGNLYFSSDWHAGLGGFDIFRSSGNLNRWNTPQNLKSPLNSPANDLNFNFNQDLKSAYFTSNRSGSYHIGGETCCYDIYYAEFPNPQVQPIDTVIPVKEVTAEKARALLPLTLYFHNDVPDPGSKSPFTTTDYLNTLKEYSGMKQRYQQEYSANLQGMEASRARTDIDTFFTRDVQGGFDKLEELGNYVLSDLQQGRSVRLRVRGFASPLTTTEYNLNLTRRRIGSLENFMMIYRDGILKPYMTDSLSEVRFEIVAEPLGESKAAPFVSDNPNDTRNSVYSIAAALERKIEITHYDAAASLDALDNLTRITFLDASKSYSGKSGQHLIVSIHFSNTGNTPFFIQGVRSSCECINASFPDISIEPGKNGIIYLLINDDVAGSYETMLTIETGPVTMTVELPLRWTFASE